MALADSIRTWASCSTRNLANSNCWAASPTLPSMVLMIDPVPAAFIEGTTRDFLDQHFRNLNTNNYRLYRNEADGRFVFLAHGMDALFANPYARIMPPMRGLIARNIMETDEGKALYVKTLREVFDTAFRADDLKAQVVETCAAVQPVLAALDPKRAARQMETAELLMSRLQERHNEVGFQLWEVEARAPARPQVSHSVVAAPGKLDLPIWRRTPPPGERNSTQPKTP